MGAALDLGPHAGFIWAAYAAAVAVLAGLVLWIRANERHQRRLLAELEARGVTRRSARTGRRGERETSGDGRK